MTANNLAGKNFRLRDDGVWEVVEEPPPAAPAVPVQKPVRKRNKSSEGKVPPATNPNNEETAHMFDQNQQNQNQQTQNPVPPAGLHQQPQAQPPQAAEEGALKSAAKAAGVGAAALALAAVTTFVTTLSAAAAVKVSRKWGLI